MIKPKVLIFLFSFVVIPQSSIAATIDVIIGDIDGFGFSDVSALISATGGPADRNGNGALDEGDSLPDLNEDRRIDPASGDLFDNRMVTDPVFTDIGYSFSQSLAFEFTFSLPTDEIVVDATFYLVAGDTSLINAAMHQITVDGLFTGAVVEPRQKYPAGDGLITVTEVHLLDSLLSNFDDGFVTFGVDYTLFPDAIAIDYARLVVTTAPVPVPASIILLGTGIGVIAGGRLRRKRHNK